MKVSISIPYSSEWPDQYKGQTVSVTVSTIQFPDGTFWNVTPELIGFANGSAPLPPPPEAASPLKDIISILKLSKGEQS